jgi:hypothetical protein
VGPTQNWGWTSVCEKQFPIAFLIWSCSPLSHQQCRIINIAKLSQTTRAFPTQLERLYCSDLEKSCPYFLKFSSLFPFVPFSCLLLKDNEDGAYFFHSCHVPLCPFFFHKKICHLYRYKYGRVLYKLFFLINCCNPISSSINRGEK